MKFKTNLKYNQVITNAELQKIFSCGNSGGMRKSNENNTLTLIADYTKGYYKDSVENDIVLYTGMGKIGDQSLYGNQNITLFESDNNNVELHFFEVFKRNEYTYKGVVELAYEPFQDFQLDINGNNRKVWIFPLIRVGDYQTLDEVLNNVIDINEKTKIVSITETELPEFTSNKKARDSTLKKEGYVKKHTEISIANQLIGDRGEKLVLQIENEKLKDLGLEDYCRKIKRVSLEDETLGYDIISYNKDCNGDVYKIFIEVKATMNNDKTNFFITNKELKVMNELKDKYFIYRVYNLDENKETGFFKIKGNEFYDKFSLTPKEYIVKIK